ncbi:zinc ribbon domain-containing protein [Undibacterium sp. CY18W]|uniref:Zinc ribbon domain-containing protein n=1 Tax=Undibacterium hunanense TaxID=2762292 RepID=A0ABR6ZXI3_9BURK|nr:FmdB family zinc ribbon protein [Undibacterium hunanense]MBC3920563.1 zinc ribbon domain-containing protein [Undibacterium hunanense]
MPIYAYRCQECGFAKDVLQKISDEPLSVCPTCGKSSFTKQVTAAGFQLKGSGWYVTDFRGGSGGAAVAPASESAPAASTESTASTAASASATTPASSTSAEGNQAV